MKKTTAIHSIFAIGVSTLFTVSVQASSTFEQKLDHSVLGNTLTQSFSDGSTELEIKQGSHRFIGEKSGGKSISSFRYSQNIAGDGLHLGFSQSQSEQYATLGYTLGRFTFSAIRGESQSFLRDAGSFQGIDRFSFHGGVDFGFDFFGAGLDAKINDKLHAQIGFARLDSNFSGLESRGVQYFELSSSSEFKGFSGLYGRLNFFERGGDSIGQGLEAGFSSDRAAYMLQALAVNGNKRLFRFRSQYAVNDATSLVFDVSQTTDPLNFDESRYSSLISIQHFIGKKPKTYYSLKEENPKAGKKKKSGIHRPILIGAGVVAVAAIASSGSDSNDSDQRSQTEREAAFLVLNGINPTSVRENREYGGWVYRNQNGTYGSSSPVRGQAASVTLPSPSSSTPSGSRITASYHTHAGFDPRFDNENFSPQDLRSDNALGIGGYLATPGGTFQYHFGSNIQVLGTVATQ